MLAERAKDHRTGRRAFRPLLEDRLESRALLSRAGIVHVAFTARINEPIHIRVANKGKIAQITNFDGQLFDAELIGPGTIYGRVLPGNRVALTLDATTSQTELSIDPLPFKRRKGQAHEFPFPQSAVNNMLNIGSIAVDSGSIGSIVGYRTAILSGPLTAAGTTPVDRIAFYSIQPGAKLAVGGDLNTLDVFTNINLGAGDSISTGRDLNWFSVLGNVHLGTGSVMSVGRDLGLTAQPAKGSDTGGQGATIQGNLAVDPGATLVVQRFTDAGFIVQGSAVGTSRVFVNPPGNFIVFGERLP
jgi:hypothetical protein